MGRAKIEPSVEATTMGLASFHLWWFFLLWGWRNEEHKT